MCQVGMPCGVRKVLRLKELVQFLGTHHTLCIPTKSYKSQGFMSGTAQAYAGSFSPCLGCGICSIYDHRCFQSMRSYGHCYINKCNSLYVTGLSTSSVNFEKAERHPEPLANYF